MISNKSLPGRFDGPSTGIGGRAVGLIRPEHVSVRLRSVMQRSEIEAGRSALPVIILIIVISPYMPSIAAMFVAACATTKPVVAINQDSLKTVFPIGLSG